MLLIWLAAVDFNCLIGARLCVGVCFFKRLCIACAWWCLLRVFISMIVTNCTGEHSFSRLKLTKNQLRSTMGQQRLNWLSLICMENDILKTNDFKPIINQFYAKKFRKKCLCWLIIINNSSCTISVCAVFQLIIIYMLKCLCFSRLMLYCSKVCVD